MIAGRYALKNMISRGGMATVWQAVDEVLARRVSVKLLHPHLTADPSFLDRFNAEALAAARLTHPNIVAIYDTGNEPDEEGRDNHYIVMEFCGGGTLQDILSAEGPLAPERVVAAGVSICDALGYAHSSGVIHRDIKPANVLVSDDRILKVADFGIAKAAFVSKDVTTTGKVLGTVAYLSPEQARGQDPDPRSDLYQLGILLYELLVGRPPFAGETAIATAMLHLQETPPRPRSLKAGVPKNLEAAVMKALEKNPEDRYANADEMASALRDSTGHTAAFSTPSVSRERIENLRRPAEPVHGEARWIVRVLVLLAIAVFSTFLLASIFNEDDETGPNGGNGGRDPGGSPDDATVLEVSEVSDFDPHGDSEEHSEDAALAVDGDETSAWETEDYDDPLNVQKPGVGLVFDLGESSEVSSVEFFGTEGLDLEIRTADEIGSTEEEFEVVEEATDAGGQETFEFSSNSGRYWLVWITNLPGDASGSASIAEVRFHGS
jgi:eukaryotic-like serine/threonine-protein kinase